MANYDALINLRLKGLDQLKEVERAINGITGRTRTGRARTSASSIAKKELSVEQDKLKTLTEVIRLKKLELALSRQAGRTAQFIEKGRTDPRLLPNTSMLGKRIAKTGQVGGVSRLQTTSQRNARFEERIAQARERSNQRNSELLGSEKLRNSQLIKTNDFIKKQNIVTRKQADNLIKLSDSFGKLGAGVSKFQEGLVPKTRTSSGKMLALPSAEMLDQRVRGSGQVGGFSRRIPRFRFPRPTKGFDAQSALISGAFPLLFGQGPIGAAAGALGGGIGGMFGQMGGFAGGIAATAIVQQIQSAITAISELGQALGPFNQDTKAITASLGLQNSVQQAQLQLIEQTEGKTAAFNAAMKLMANDIGQTGVKALKKFGETSRIINSQLKVFGTALQSVAARILNFILEITGIEKGLKLADARRLVKSEATLGNEEAKKLQKNIDKTKGIRTDFGILGPISEKDREGSVLKKQTDDATELFAIREKINTQLKIEFSDLIAISKEKADQVALEESINKLKKTYNTDVATEIANINQVAEKAKDKLNVQINELKDKEKLGKLSVNEKGELEAKIKFLEKIDSLNKDAIKDIITLGSETEKIKITRQEIADLLANETTSAVMGLIEGTKTLGEALASVAKSFARMFLNAGFQNMFNSLIVKQEQGGYNRAGSFKAFQYGGVVSSPTLGMIGEGGEPEYVIPSSKMSGAMARYSAGARGGAVIPGGSGASGTVAGSSGNTIVEYTGPVLNFNGDEYVPKSAVPEIINTAARQGGEAGKTKAISALRNSRSQRASLGL